MNKLFVIADREKRFHTNLGSSHPETVACEACNLPTERMEDESAVYWETEFSDVGRAVAAKRQVYFAEGFAIYAVKSAMELLLDSKLPLKFEPAMFVSPEWIGQKAENSLPDKLWRVRPLRMIDVASEPTGFRICKTCNHFSDGAWHVTRLQIRSNLAEECGIFGVVQNRGGAVFVTEELREQFAAFELEGLGFYPAGKTV
jgi:hypothetical protein